MLLGVPVSTDDSESASVAIDSFIHSACSELLEDGMVLASTVLFQYMTADKKVGYGVVNHKSTSKGMAMRLVVAAGKTFERGRGEENV